MARSAAAIILHGNNSRITGQEDAMGYGLSVTQRVAEIEKPARFLSLKTFDKAQYDDGKELALDENVAPGAVGTAVDCLTRIRFGAKPEEAFDIAIAGAKKMEKAGAKNALAVCVALVAETADADSDEAIAAACKLSGCFDAFYRSGYYKPPREIEPDEGTIFNIRTMLGRCQTFILDRYGPVILSGFTFGDGYTDIVSTGDGDYLLVGGLFDFKVMKGDPKPKHTLQLLMYYLMGLASGRPEFRGANLIGFYNPRLNRAHIKDVTEIPKEVLREVAVDVIGYDEVPEGAGEKPDLRTAVRASLGLE